MPFRKSPSMDRAGVERMAEGWGKIVARRVHEDVGPELDLDAEGIEQMAATAARAVARGTIEELLERKASLLGAEQPCPTCKRLCTVQRQQRSIDFWGGEVRYAEPKCHCTACRRDFFPHRPSLRLTSHDYSPSVLRKIVRCGAREPSFREAAEAMAELAEVTISERQVGRIAHEVGQQLQADRDDHVSSFQAKTLAPRVSTRPALAVIEVDGGRLQIRGQGDGPGAHEPTWREDKIAILATMANAVSDSDPEPELPDCYRDRVYVEHLVASMSGSGSMGTQEAPAEGLPPPSVDRVEPRKRPELSVRTYVASTCSSEQFGLMVAAEARRRNLPKAVHQAFLGDGSAWIWKLQQLHFPTFLAILDFLHGLGHVFAAARAAAIDVEGRWELFEAWAEACWKGRVDQVIVELRTLRDAQASFFGDEVEQLADDDPRKIIAQELGYLERNRERMDYPSYRRLGLPWTSSHVESTVKIFNRRVKGSEKFWGEAGAEAMLQLRASFLSEDGRLDRYLKERPASPFRNYKTRGTGKAA